MMKFLLCVLALGAVSGDDIDDDTEKVTRVQVFMYLIGNFDAYPPWFEEVIEAKKLNILKRHDQSNHEEGQLAPGGTGLDEEPTDSGQPGGEVQPGEEEDDGRERDVDDEDEDDEVEDNEGDENEDDEDEENDSDEGEDDEGENNEGGGNEDGEGEENDGDEGEDDGDDEESRRKQKKAYDWIPILRIQNDQLDEIPSVPEWYKEVMIQGEKINRHFEKHLKITLAHKLYPDWFIEWYNGFIYRRTKLRNLKNVHITWRLAVPWVDGIPLYD